MDISKQLSAIAKAMGCRYCLNGEPLSYEEVFSPTGFLPYLMRRADQLCSFCLGYGLGLTFDRAENSKTGLVVQFDTVTPVVLRLLCVTDVLQELMQQATSPDMVALDDLIKESG